MTVSLVKSPPITPATVVYVVGYTYGPFMPNPDSVAVYATIDAAREALADDLTRAAEIAAEQASYDGDDFDNEAAASISASAELVTNDRDGDITWAIQRHGGWLTVEPDGYTYYLETATLADVFGDDTASDKYLDLIDAILGRD